MAIHVLQFAIIVLLTLANGFFAASEIAIVSARRGRLQQRAEGGSRNARLALQLAEEPNRFLATVQVGISLIGTFAAAFGGDVLADPLAQTLAPYTGARYAEAIALTLVVLLITYLSLILGELVPKRLALQRAETIAAAVAPAMQLVSRLAAPVVWFLTISTQAVLRVLGRSREEEEQVTEEDVLSLVREGTETGTFEVTEEELIERVFDLTDRTARSIMTPRKEIFALAIDTPLDEAVRRVIESGYSRIPVYRDSLDMIAGILYVKDLLRATQPTADGTKAPPQLEELLRPPVFVLEHQRSSAILQQFKQTRTHLALVLDEYGQVDGLITLEDLLEELTGDIEDEYDETTTMVVERPDGSFLVDGLLAYADAERRLGFPPHEELDDLPDFDTIAGLILALLEHIPTTGEHVTWRQWTFEVVDMDGVRIDKVLVQPLKLDQQAQAEATLALRAVLPPAQPAPQVRNNQLPQQDDKRE
ncbi:MAG: hemolysin family protein [Chloroflexota bacterium]|nr:hemolysin family protein [Chloroflexota bacterium]